MRTKKFRVWDFKEKKFDYFDLSKMTVSEYRLAYEHLYQFIGIRDKNMCEIYERDVVKGIYGLEGLEVIGEVNYCNNKCAYVVDWHYEISNIELDSLEIVGNMIEDYMYDEKRELVTHNNHQLPL